jgi:hypothetical protein
MATFLTTPRMNPELRARVERAVSHRARARHHAARAGLPGTFASRERLRLARLLPMVALVLVGVLGTATYVYGQKAVEAERSALIAAIEERRASLPAGHEAFLGATDHYITETASDSAPPDHVDPALRAAGALDAWLRRPAVYVRGAAADLRDAQKIEGAALASVKDSFLVCLQNPPASTSEKDLLAKVRGVYFGGAKVDDETANVRRLTEARAGLSLLGPAFEETARTVKEISAIRKLRRELDGAPIEAARKALSAELLIVAVDTAGKTNAREARVALVDLTSRKVLLRLRPRFEAQGRSAASAVHRAEMEGCALAFEVRRGVSAE